MLPLALLALFLKPAAASASPLDYDGKPPARSDVREVSRARGRVEYEIKFASPVKSPFPANDVVWARFSVPEGVHNVPCILVLPVMAAPNIWIEERFIHRFERDGFAIMWLEMPYQFHRRADPSEPSGQVFLARTAARLAFNFRQAALDARRALAWLKTRPEVDASRIGIFGVSLGAMVGSAVYSVDPTPKHAVFLLGGADFPDLVAHSSMTRPFLRKAHIDPGELKKEWEGLDPLDYQEKNKGKTPLLINASWDWVIPKANGLKLARAFPQSRQEWVPLGHYSAILHLIWIPRHVSRDFLKNL